METDLERRAEKIFDQTLDAPTADRPAAIVAACGNDAALLARVNALFAANQADGFLDETPQFAAARTLDTAVIGEGPGSVIGRYKLLEQIGEGGFGIVFMAEQEKPVRRRVALKVIKLGMDTKEVVARFEAERQALALMDHPNIARVFDAGSTDTGRPYFVMELVRGSPITEYADHVKMPTRDRVALAVQVARAVQHAHSKGVIHRDLKPSNVLVTVADDKPIPKVIDFGIAKATQSRLTDRTLFTQFRQMIGTPQYMSPEQADSNGVDVDTRTDIYSLGVLIYELLVGTTPMDAKQLRSAAYEAMRKMICDTDLPRPATRLHTLAAADQSDIAARRSTDVKKLSEAVKGELDWIVMKALEKDRTRRYDTAAALADDLNRFVMGEAVLAGPMSGTYRLKKALKKYRAAAITGGVIAACLLLGIAGTTWGLILAEHQRTRAETNAAHAVKAEQRATEQATVAESARSQADQARQDAERQAEIATRAAARSDAQYLLGAGLLQDSFVRAGDAWKLGGLWEDGFTLDRIRTAAQRNWHLAGTIAANGSTVGCLCKHSAESVLVLADDSGLTAYSVSTAKPTGRAVPPSPVVKLIGDPDGNAVTVFRADGVDRFSLPDLRLLATHSLPFRWQSVDATAGGVLILDNNSDCHVFSPADLSEVDTLIWDQQPPGMRRVRPTKVAISPSGRRILLRTDWWSKVQLWDRDQQDQNRLKYTASNQVDELRFITDDAYAAWQELDTTGGAGGHVEVRSIAPPNTGINSFATAVSNETLKKDVGIEGWVDPASHQVRYALIGSVGYNLGNSGDQSGEKFQSEYDAGDVVSEAGSSPESDHYASLVPTDAVEPAYLCSNFGEGLLALRHKDQVLVYDRAMESSLLQMADFSAAACDAGLLRVKNGIDERRHLFFTPFDRSRPTVSYPIQWAQSTGSTPHLIPWALGATADGSTIVVIAQESSRSNTSTDQFGTSHAMIYRNVGGLPPGAKSLPLTASFDLHSVPIGNWNLRSVAVEPTGRVMLWMSSENQARRYSLVDGKLLGIVPLSRVARPSADGRFVAGIQPDDYSLSVFDIATGNRVLSIPGHAHSVGVCLSTDNRQLLVGDGGVLQTYSVPAGNLLASVPSTLIPMVVPGTDELKDRIFAFRADAANANSGDLVVADRTGHVTAVLARTGTGKSAAYLSPDGRALAIVQSRWQFGVFQSISPAQLTAAVNSHLASVGTDIAESALPNVQLVATTEPAADVVDPTDIKALTDHVGKAVIIRGMVKVVDWSEGRTFANLRFDDSDKKEFAVFISPAGVKKFVRTTGDKFLDGLLSANVEVHGRLVRYTFASGESILNVVVGAPSQIKKIPATP